MKLRDRVGGVPPWYPLVVVVVVTVKSLIIPISNA